MNFLTNYDDIRKQFSYFQNEARRKKLLETAQTYSREDASGLNNAAMRLHTDFRQGFNGLRNTGMQASGEVERLKKKLRSTFLDTQNRLVLAEREKLMRAAEKLRSRALKAETPAADETAKAAPLADGTAGRGALPFLGGAVLSGGRAAMPASAPSLLKAADAGKMRAPRKKNA